MTINDVLADIQTRLHAPKDKRNEFGKYNYRNAESIIAAFKSLNVEGASLRCVDTLQEVGGQIFVSAEAILTVGTESVSATAHAMHPLQKKGMDASQITGSASSYARKYALAGLFAIDDGSQDPDARDNREENGQPKFNAIAAADRIKERLRKAADLGALGAIWREENSTISDVKAVDPALEAQIIALKDQRKTDLTISGDEIPY